MLRPKWKKIAEYLFYSNNSLKFVAKNLTEQRKQGKRKKGKWSRWNLEQEQTGETETEQTGENVPDNDLRELELADFQKLQNKLYAVGKEANKSIVTVTGVKSDTDWFNNPYESKGQASGIIVAESSRELLVLTERKAIADAQEIYVTFINDVSVKAEMKKYDGNTGIAVLSVKTSELTDKGEIENVGNYLQDAMTVILG